eukprot:s3038_g18.t1
MSVAFKCTHGSQDPYASGFAEAPFLLRRLKHTNIGAPSAGGRAHCSQKHRRVLTMEHSLPPSIGVGDSHRLQQCMCAASPVPFHWQETGKFARSGKTSHIIFKIVVLPGWD